MNTKTLLLLCLITLVVSVLSLAFSLVEISSTIRIPGERQAHVRFLEFASVAIDGFSTDVNLDGQLDIPIEQPFEIPLDFELSFPINAALRLDTEITIATELPVNFKFEPRDDELRDLWIDIDTDIIVDDEMEINLMLPVTAPVQTFGFLPVPIQGEIPVRAVVPIRQPLRIKDRIKVGLSGLSMDVNTSVPLNLRIPIHQDVHVKGEVIGRVRKNIVVPISERISVPLRTSMPVGLQFEKPLKVVLAEFVPISIRFDETLPIQVEGVGLSRGTGPAAAVQE